MTDDMDEPGWHRADGADRHYYRRDSVAATVCADCGGRPTAEVHLDRAHLRKEPRLGQSIWLSIDHHLLAHQERFERAEAEVRRLTSHLEFIEAMGDGGGNVAGTPLALYARAAIENRVP